MVRASPLTVGCADTVVDDGCVPAHLACARGVGSVAFHDFDVLWCCHGPAAAIDQADAFSLPVEFAHHRQTYRSSAKDDMEFITGHHRFFLFLTTYVGYLLTTQLNADTTGDLQRTEAVNSTLL